MNKIGVSMDWQGSTGKIIRAFAPAAEITQDVVQQRIGGLQRPGVIFHRRSAACIAMHEAL